MGNDIFRENCLLSTNEIPIESPGSEESIGVSIVNVTTTQREIWVSMCWLR